MTLGQVYKAKLDGEYRGSPAFYIEKGWVSSGMPGFSRLPRGVFLRCAQANSIGASLDIAFGISWNVTAALFAPLLGFIIFVGKVYCELFRYPGAID
ncbi:alanine:cation symporter family protein [Serratia sp. IR-2025]